MEALFYIIKLYLVLDYSYRIICVLLSSILKEKKIELLTKLINILSKGFSDTSKSIIDKYFKKNKN